MGITSCGNVAMSKAQECGSGYLPERENLAGLVERVTFTMADTEVKSLGL